MSEAPADCVIVQPIAEPGLRLLRKAGLRLHLATTPDFTAMAPVLRSAIAVITRNAGFPMEAIAAAGRLLVIGSHGTGTDAIDRRAAEARDIAVVSTPGANAQSVAELTLLLMLATARHLAAANAAVRSGDHGFRLRMKGLELAGRTLGLVGFGEVARRVAPTARALGLEVVGWSRHAVTAAMREAGIERRISLAALLGEADIVSLHAAGGKTLIGGTEFAAMKPGAILVNTARGSLVDEAALVEALNSGRLAGAALDVTALEPLPAGSPLLAAPNLILTPHLGSTTEAALERTSLAVARRVLEVLYERGAIRSLPD